MPLENVHDRDLTHEPVSPNQVSPIPKSTLNANVDRAKAVRQVIEAHPGAGVDQVIALLAKQQIQVSATLVMQQLMKSRPAAENSA